jgi:hypothetical protein
MPVVIGLTGYSGAGKDEAAKGLVSLGWQRVSFADGVRDLAVAANPEFNFGRDDGRWRLADYVEQYGWNDAKQCKPVREFLQDLGVGARNVIGKIVWVETARKKMQQAMEAGRNVVITDVRFPDEATFLAEIFMYMPNWLKTDEDGRVVRITRPSVGPVNNHCTETAVDSINPDHTIVNDGTPEELQAKLVAYAESLTSVTS